jgi:hypothetical protein
LIGILLELFCQIEEKLKIYNSDYLNEKVNLDLSIRIINLIFIKAYEKRIYLKIN